MASVSSEEEGSDDRCGSYSPSADVSGSETSSECSGRRRYGAASASFSAAGASSSFSSSPLPPSNGVIFWDGKLEKRDELSGPNFLFYEILFLKNLVFLDVLKILPFSLILHFGGSCASDKLNCLVYFFLVSCYIGKRFTLALSFFIWKFDFQNIYRSAL